MKRTLILVLTVITCFTCIAQQTTIEVNVSLAKVGVEVIDALGRSVKGLTKSDFIVLDNNQPQDIVAFESAEGPFSLLLVIDRNSLTVDPLSVEPSINGLLRLLPSQAQLAIAVVDDQVELVADWQIANRASPLNIVITPTTRTMISQYSDPAFAVRAGGESQKTSNGGRNVDPQTDKPLSSSDRFKLPAVTDEPLYRAIAWASREIDKRSGRKFVVFFTDGALERAKTKELTLQGKKWPALVDAVDDSAFKTINKLMQSSVSHFYFVSPRPYLNFAEGLSVWRMHDIQERKSRINVLAEASGGKRLEIGTVADLLPALESILKEAGSSFELTYRSVNTSGHHRIEVRTTSSTLTVHQNRTGYDVP